MRGEDRGGGDAKAKRRNAAFDKTFAPTLKATGYPAKADLVQLNWPITITILTILVIYLTMLYGLIAAMLVGMFPARIHYTPMLLPYHIGNGLVRRASCRGGRVRDCRRTGRHLLHIYSGLWYPIMIALITFVIGLLFVEETKDSNIYAQD